MYSKPFNHPSSESPYLGATPTVRAGRVSMHRGKYAERPRATTYSAPFGKTDHCPNSFFVMTCDYPTQKYLWYFVTLGLPMLGALGGTHLANRYGKNNKVLKNLLPMAGVGLGLSATWIAEYFNDEAGSRTWGMRSTQTAVDE